MGQPAAKQGDQIMATDTHIIMIPSPGGPVPTPLPHPFVGIINGDCSTNVKIMSMPAATVGSTAMNTPPHIPHGGSLPETAIQPGEDYHGQHDGLYQQQTGGAQRRYRNDL